MGFVFCFGCFDSLPHLVDNCFLERERERERGREGEGEREKRESKNHYPANIFGPETVICLLRLLQLFKCTRPPDKSA